MDAEANIEADNHNAQQVVILTRFRVLRPNVRFGSFAEMRGLEAALSGFDARTLLVEPLPARLVNRTEPSKRQEASI